MPSRAKCGSLMTRPQCYTEDIIRARRVYSCRTWKMYDLRNQWNSDAEVAFPTFLMGIVGLESIRSTLARGCPSAPQMTLGSPSLGRRQVSGRETTTPRKSSPQISNRSSFSSHLLYPLDLFFTTNELRLYYYFILRDIFHTPTAQIGSCTTN